MVVPSFHTAQLQECLQRMQAGDLAARDELLRGVGRQLERLAQRMLRGFPTLPRLAGEPKVFRFVEYRPGRAARPICVAAISHRVSRLAKEAGLRLTMHTLRKGFGCRYAGKVPAQVLQRLMRHANIKTTMDYYANIDNAVEEAVLGPRTPHRNTERNTTPEAVETAQDGVATTDSRSESCATS